MVFIQLTGDEATGDATIEDVLKDKTFSNPSKTGLTGTRPGALVEKTGQTTSPGTRDDGALQRGVTWPSPRFTDNGDGTVTDNLTGLIWLKDANYDGEKRWTNALT